MLQLRRRIASISGRYYFEDGHRVSPECQDKNFPNHGKFYKFAAQFVARKRVADVGCGTGYGCEIPNAAGASFVGGSEGIIVSEDINLSETMLPDGSQVQLKKGLEPGVYAFAGYNIDTTLLHNAHSWAIVAVNGN